MGESIHPLINRREDSNCFVEEQMTRDLRKYAKQTNFQLIIGTILILFVVGLGLIYLFYGPAAAVFGLVCLVAGLSPLVLITIILWGIDRFVKRVNEE